MSSLVEDLSQLREEIDRIDHQIIELLKARIEVVHKVGKYKSQHSQTVSFIRSGREARMLRDLTDKLKDTLPAAAVGTIWRMIISTSLNLEQGMSIASYVTTENPSCYWLAREYFGSFVPISKDAKADDVIHKVAASEVAVGILPFFDNGNAAPWWVRPQKEQNDIYIFARIPFIEQPHHNDTPVLAIANVLPEETGDDRSLLAIHTTPDTQSDIIAHISETFDSGITVLESYGSSDHLVEVDCFIDKNDENFKRLCQQLGKEQSIRYMGAYATPITL